MRSIVCAAAVFIAALLAAPGLVSQSGPPDAPRGFDLDPLDGLPVSNGFLEEFCAKQDFLTSSPNSPEIPDDECNRDAAAEEFTGPESADDGLGPIFNAAGCGECHSVPVLGGSSQIAERRAGLFQNGVFTDHPGGSLIQDRATSGATQETTFAANTNVMALRASLSVFGLGFVEALSNTTLTNIRNAQPSGQRGTIINVPVFERPGTTRVGRFGWKDQQASLVSFSADAYLNEMGITSPLQPDEPTSNGTPVSEDVEDPDLPGTGIDDSGVDVELFALFMRDLRAPGRGPGADSDDAKAGELIFENIGCDVCHTPSMVTSDPGTTINGGALKVANALGRKKIRPFGDFLLHDIGTGDGIVQNGGAATRNQVRTVPLWGLHARGRFMHDGLSFNLEDAIARHGGQASSARSNFNALGSTSRRRLLTFLKSL